MVIFFLWPACLYVCLILPGAATKGWQQVVKSELADSISEYSQSRKLSVERELKNKAPQHQSVQQLPIDYLKPE